VCVLVRACCVAAHGQDFIKTRGCSLNWRRCHRIPLNNWSKPRKVSFTTISSLSQIRTYYRQNIKPRRYGFNNVTRPSPTGMQPYAFNGRAPVWFERTDEKRIGNKNSSRDSLKDKESAVFKTTPVGTKSHSSRSWHIDFQDSYPDSSKASRKRQGRCYHNSDYVYILNELLICDSEYTNVDVHESVHRDKIMKSNQQYTNIQVNLLYLVSSTAVSTHPWHQPAATCVNTTRYCKYSQVLLMMGENITRNMY
jgi:hypothetical protein